MNIKYLTICSLAAIGLSLSACEVEKTQEGELPEVDVDVTEGQLPHYDVDAPEVNVTTKETEIQVPNVDVNMEEKTITVPDVDVDMPEDTDDDDPVDG